MESFEKKILKKKLLIELFKELDLATYTCPLCKTKYKRFKWFVKHINRYSDEEKEKIFLKNGKLLKQEDLLKYLKTFKE